MLPLVAQSCVTPGTVARQAPLSMRFSRQEDYRGLPCPPPGDLPDPGSNPGLPHFGWIVYRLSHQGSPRILEWVAYPFSRGSSPPSSQSVVSCIAGGFFTSRATREAPILHTPHTHTYIYTHIHTHTYICVCIYIYIYIYIYI